MTNVTIEAVSYVLPPHVVSSDDIEQQIADTLARIGIPLGQLKGLTGVYERRFWDPGVKSSDGATMAARKLIDESGINPDDIDIIINSSVSKDYVEPAVASLVHGNLGLKPECMNYDLGSACMGFLNAISNISLMIEAGLVKYGLIVNGENTRELVECTLERLKSQDTGLTDLYNYFASLTFGSGAAAMLLCHKKISKTGHIINDAVYRAATEYSRLCYGQNDGIIADGPTLLKKGISLAKETWDIASATILNWSDNEIDAYFPHQVGERQLTALNKTLGLTPEKSFLTYPFLGNTGPASIPMSMAMAIEQNRIKRGDHLVLMGIGSGINCGMMSVNW